MQGPRSAEQESKSGVSGLTVRMLRFVVVFLLFPAIIVMNACSLSTTERSHSTGSGMLTAEVALLNVGAMSDYSGAVWVFPKYFPRVWPLDLLVGCRALMFESDPRIDLTWSHSALVIEHDPFAYPAIKVDRCFGRTITLRERAP
jgi:hypothetical protein